MNLSPLRLALPLATALALVLSGTTSALACGGGGSGAYRKPPRPGQHLHSAAVPAQGLNGGGATQSGDRN